MVVKSFVPYYYYLIIIIPIDLRVAEVDSLYNRYAMFDQRPSKRDEALCRLEKGSGRFTALAHMNVNGSGWEELPVSFTFFFYFFSNLWDDRNQCLCNMFSVGLLCTFDHLRASIESLILASMAFFNSSRSSAENNLFQ